METSGDPWAVKPVAGPASSERLAEHYGLVGVQGPHMRRVALPTRRRGGVLTQASVLTVTSNPARTSPVQRGKWILETLLDAPPPAPPPGLDGLDTPSADERLTLRERLERHRADPNCAVCHDRMDPLGFALETYDGVGRWRTREGEREIDASARLPDGRVLDGIDGLRDVLRDEPAFLRSLARNLLVYALGRGLSRADDPEVGHLVAALAEGRTLSTLAMGIVGSEAFRRRPAAEDG